MKCILQLPFVSESTLVCYILNDSSEEVHIKSFLFKICNVNKKFSKYF